MSIRFLPSALALILVAHLTACSDDTTPSASDDCGPDQTLVDGQCVTEEEPVEDVVEPDDAEADTHDDDTDEPGDVEPPPTDTVPSPETGVVQCGDRPLTSVSGVITIPSGDLPLPDVNIFVPIGELQPIHTGATCEPCGRRLSGFPLTQATSDIEGRFRLINVPANQPFPLVVEVGKWRRMVIVPPVEPCQDTELDIEYTRLPRSTEEGDLPQFGVTTGGWDAMECLLRKIGIEDSEFSTDTGDGRVHLFAGREGTNRFVPTLNNGAQFRNAWDWWNDVDNLAPYDILVYSCEGSAHGRDKPTAATNALMEYTYLNGGRAFLSHYHYYWLSNGPPDFRAVANWDSLSSALSDPEMGFIRNDFPKGAQLAEWMFRTGSAVLGEFPIYQPRGSIRSINRNVATEWIVAEPTCDPIMQSSFPWLCQDGAEVVQYFSFNTPVFAPEEDQCGRVVFSDIHVSANDNSSPSTPFPTGCTTQGLTDQEKAIVFMLFDLARCVVADKR